MEHDPSRNRAELRRRAGELLLERGLDDEETLRILAEYWAEREQRADTAGDRLADQIWYMIDVARLALEVGMTDVAAGEFEDALYRAQQEGREDLYSEVLRQRDELMPAEGDAS